MLAPETLKMVTSCFDPKTGTVQAATGSIDGIPTFPHTKVPIMPPDKDYHQRKAFMNTKGMIRSSWRRFRNSCGTNHHPQYNALSAHGGCVPLGFCAVDPGRKLRIAPIIAGLLRLRNAGNYRLLRSRLRMTCYPSTGGSSPSTPSPKRAICYSLLDLAREDHHGRD